MPSSLKFRFRTGEIRVDYGCCSRCRTYACAKADSLFGTGILRIQNNQPSLTLSLEETKKRCNECLACELYCQSYGNKGLSIELDKLESKQKSVQLGKKDG